MPEKPVLSLVIPCYNEEKNLLELVREFAQARKGFPIELILVDNGSRDNSAEILKRLAAERDFIKIVTVEKNVGYGHGILSGLREARGEFLAWTHADLQADPADVIRAWQLLEKEGNPENVLVKGSRGKRPLLDLVFTNGFGLFSSLLLGFWLSDINAQPKLFHKSFLQKMKNPPLDFALDVYVMALAKKLGMKIISLPVEFKERLHGESKSAPTLAAKLRTTMKMAKYVLKVRSENLL